MENAIPALSSYIAIMLLIMPGFISHNIVTFLGSNVASQDKFGTTVISLSYSVFIMMIDYGILWLNGITPNVSMLNDPINVVIFTAITLFVSIVVRITWAAVIRRIVCWGLNQIRCGWLQKSKMDDMTTMDAVFNCENFSPIVKVIKGDKSYFGVMTDVGTKDDPSIYVERSDYYTNKKKNRPDDLMVSGVYFDIVNDIIIEKGTVK